METPLFVDTLVIYQYKNLNFKKEYQMKSVFISYDHDDQEHLHTIKSIRLNPSNPIEFIDRSLKEPILNDYGHINRRQPGDSASLPVRSEIEKLLTQSSKLLVLVGRDTHSSEWVKWEIECFTRLKRNGSILLMRVPSNSSAGAPLGSRHLDIQDWSSIKLTEWLGD